MGQVFTWDAIQTGRIPKMESFHRVAEDLRAALSAEPSIECALLFGSVVRGDFDVRSDIDCAVIYDVRDEERAMRTMHACSRSAHALHVPVTFAPCDTAVAKTRLHHLHRSFVKHLEASIEAGGLIKGDFVGLLASTVSLEQEIESYIKMKMYSLQESFAQMPTFNKERMAAFLKKALEAPMHVARKMLIYNGTLEGDSKREVQKRYHEIMPFALSSQFNFLLSVDRLYSVELQYHLEEPPNQKEQYESILDELQKQIPSVIGFLRSSIIAINDAH